MAYYDFDYVDYDFYDYNFAEEDDFLDEYAYIHNQRDAYIRNFYTKIFYNMPDISDLNKDNQVDLTECYRRYNTIGVDEVITYEKLHSVITVTERLFVLWQKRLSHEWTKDVKRPVKSVENKTDGHKDEATGGDSSDKNKEPYNGNDGGNHLQNFCPHLAHAVQVLEDYSLLHDILSPMFSDDEDYYDYGFYDSDEWDSSIDDVHSLNGEDFPKNESKSRKAKDETEAMERYRKSAEKYFAAFPEKEDTDTVLNDLNTMKGWINNLYVSILTKSIGRNLPHLVIEKIIEMLSNRFGILELRVGSVAKTTRFIDIENARKKELYCALLEIRNLFFEILFKNHIVSETFDLMEYVKKIFHIAMRRFVMLEELVSWLQGDETACFEAPGSFMSGIFHCKHLKASGRDFDYMQPLNDAFTSFDGRRLAILVPGASKESCIKIYDVITHRCVALKTLDKDDYALGVAIQGNYLALMLRRDSLCRVEIHDFLSGYTKIPLTLDLGISSKKTVKRLQFVTFDDSRKLLGQKEDDLFVIDVSKKEDGATLSCQKTYPSLELLGAKDHFMIARDFIGNKKHLDFLSVGEIEEISKKVTGIKIFDLKCDSLLRVIPHPKTENNSLPNSLWSATVDTAPGSLKFVIWVQNSLQLWDLEGVPEKKKDITLGKRVANGTKLVLNDNILAIQSTQSSFDSSFDTVDLTEIMFYDINTEKVYYHETYHGMFENPLCHISTGGGHIYGLHMANDLLLTLHSSTNGGEVRIYNFGLSHEKIMALQIEELAVKRREEELKRKIKEAERQRQNEERMRKKEEQRLKRLDKKRKQREVQLKKRQQAETLKKATQAGAYVVGEITEWRGTYGFMHIDGMGDAFVHITDILGRPRITPGCRIHCQLQEQIGHMRPKAVQASLLRF